MFLSASVADSGMLAGKLLLLGMVYAFEKVLLLLMVYACREVLLLMV